MLLRLTTAAASLAVLATAAHAQSDRWDGADDLEVSPLGCEAGAEPTVVPKEYDGGQPEAAPDLAGQDITLMAPVSSTRRKFLRRRASPKPTATGTQACSI
jgi:hypothetical protein